MMTERVLPYPRLSDNGDGTVKLTIDTIAWNEDADDTLFEIGTQEDAIRLYSRVWCVENGYPKWADLLADPVGLIRYHAQMKLMRFGN